uniref:Putative reverse transcriptase domain-containing protein n=1 Tax=Tanacetum cinerariifolium TaxID=118510 RepID=A0A6L2M949_TANCI|nr:putative reverse transcriptase domain-containing protein [Tanacetum cinerariifolium]
MRHHRLIELFSDYVYEIRYHPGKANVVAGALSWRERVKPKRVRAINMPIQSSIKSKILAALEEASDEYAELQKGLDEMIRRRSDGALYYLGRIWVPLKGDVRTLIMDEAHKSKYSVHPGADKMYYDLRDRKCGSLIMWEEVGEGHLIGLELVQETTKKISRIKDKLKAKGVVHFWKKGKLAPRFVGPFEIIEKVGPMAYRLDLPEELDGVHDMFYVSDLKKCLAEPTLQVPLDEI